MKVKKKVSKEEFRYWLYYNLDVSDSKLYEEMNNPNAIGIFQMNGQAAQGIIQKVHPDNFEELNACNALSRPGPIENTPLYVSHKQGEKSPYPDMMNEITEKTFSIPLFQEQIMEIFQKLGGFTFEEADSVRSLMKKLGKAEKDPDDLKKWNKTVERFKRNAIEKNGLKENEVDKITKDLVSFASYSFNRCFSGDMKIDRDNTARWHPTIEEMYLTKNNREGYGYAKSLAEDGRLYLNRIVDIYKREIQNVYKITLESGESIEVSSNHKFPTDYGELTINSGLEEGICLYVNIDNLQIRKERIYSIEYVGNKQTYDVEMEAPYHTLSVNNIVASNSHSTAYTYIAVITLYLSVYFQKYFYSAVLDYEIDRDKMLFERMQSIRNRGYSILQPDVNKSGVNIQPGEGNTILLGLSDVKYVGEKPANKIIENRPYKSLFEFVMKTRSREVSSRVIESLIKAGALDEIIDGERVRALQTFVQFWKNKGNTKVREKLEALWTKIDEHHKNLPYFTTTQKKLREFEKDIFGFNFFTSLFTKENIEMFKKMEEQNLVHISLDDVSPFSRKVPVALNEVRVVKDKNGNEMAFISIEDMYGNKQSVPVFASYWKHIKGEFEEDELFLLNLFRDENGGILFGKKQFIRSSHEIIRMVKKVPQ